MSFVRAAHWISLGGKCRYWRLWRGPGIGNADDIDRLFKINIHAPYHASVEAARQMPEGGRILIIGSVNGDRMPVAGMAAYAASKSALQGMARGLARDFGPRGITINVVQPGPIDTDANPANGPMRDMLHSLMAIKRHGQPEEVAGMVAWLAGPEASFVTGAMHTIGWRVWRITDYAQLSPAIIHDVLGFVYSRHTR